MHLFWPKCLRCDELGSVLSFKLGNICFFYRTGWTENEIHLQVDFIFWEPCYRILYWKPYFYQTWVARLCASINGRHGPFAQTTIVTPQLIMYLTQLPSRHLISHIKTHFFWGIPSKFCFTKFKVLPQPEKHRICRHAHTPCLTNTGGCTLLHLLLTVLTVCLVACYTNTIRIIHHRLLHAGLGLVLMTRSDPLLFLWPLHQLMLWISGMPNCTPDAGQCGFSPIPPPCSW